MRTYNTYNAKSGAINRPEKVICKLGAEEGRCRVNQAEASEDWGYWEQDVQRPWGRRDQARWRGLREANWSLSGFAISTSPDLPTSVLHLPSCFLVHSTCVCQCPLTPECPNSPPLTWNAVSSGFLTNVCPFWNSTQTPPFSLTLPFK